MSNFTPPLRVRTRSLTGLVLWVAAAALVMLSSTNKVWPAAQDTYAGDSACRNCHRDEFESYQATAHHRTSRLADGAAVAGHFSGRASVMTTFNPELTFRMEARNGHYYETSILNKRGHLRTHSEPIDLVVGSATKGQTYLYWRGDQLFELPVSYWTALDAWVNSPGYVDGSADFERPVTGRCLECHATSINNLSADPSGNRYDRNSLVLGIGCERCHGPGSSHIQSHSTNTASAPMPPVGLNRDREIDVCAQCHGGVGQSLVPPFSFRPGEDLARSIALSQAASTKQVDVHGNQVILLERSRCFLSSPTMSCSTCHNVHSVERTAASYSAKCLQCHQQQQCGMFANLGAVIATNCIDCHMPVQESKSLVLDVEDERLRAKVRNHNIAVYAQRTMPAN